MELEDITQSSCVDILHALGSEFDPFNPLLLLSELLSETQVSPNRY